MKRKLIISQEQFNRLNEGVSVNARTPNDVDAAFSRNATNVNIPGEGDGPEITMGYSDYKNQSSLPASDRTIVTGASRINIVNDTMNNSLTETYKLNKGTIEHARKMSKKMSIGDKLYSKKDFAKKLQEEYSEFNNRLNERRKNGK